MWFVNRIRQLIHKMLSLAFLTWVAITYIKLMNKEPLDINYYLFTAALVGFKIFAPRAKE